jgi:hypothetical protein
VRHGAGALAAAPAVDERAPGLGLVLEELRDVLADVLRHQRGAELLRVERRDLLVQRSDLRALGVVEHRRGNGAGDVVLGVFGGRARVDNRVVLLEIHL